jgi:hypothetical protein
LRSGDAFAGQQLDQLGLARHCVVGEQLRDAVLPLRLGERAGVA